MTNGKTILKFSHKPDHALQAGIDALTLAATWLPERTADLRDEIVTRIDDLKDIKRRLGGTPKSIPVRR